MPTVHSSTEVAINSNNDPINNNKYQYININHSDSMRFSNIAVAHLDVAGPSGQRPSSDCNDRVSCCCCRLCLYLTIIYYHHNLNLIPTQLTTLLFFYCKHHIRRDIRIPTARGGRKMGWMVLNLVPLVCQ